MYNCFSLKNYLCVKYILTQYQVCIYTFDIMLEYEDYIKHNDFEAMNDELLAFWNYISI